MNRFFHDRSLLQHFADPGCTFLLQPGVLLQLRGVHGETRGGTPRGVVKLERPVLNTFGETETGLALEDVLGDVAQAGQFGAAAAEENAADERAFHADAGEFAAYEAKQLLGAGAQNAVDQGALRFARLAIFRGGQFHQDLLGGAFGQRAAEFHFDQLGVLEAEAETLGEIAREVVAGDAAGGGEVHGVAIVDHQFGGFRADIDHGDALAAVLGQDGGVAGAERFEDRLLHREVVGVDGADEGVVLLNGGGDQVDVDFQARGEHFARVTVPGMAVHHEILREELQDHAVFHQLHPGGALHNAADVGLLDLLHVAELEHAAAVGAAHGGATHAHYHRLQGARGEGIGIAQRGGHGFGGGLLVGDPPFGPSLRLHGAGSHKANAAVFQDTDHQPRLAAAGVEPRCVNRFDCHGPFYSFTVNRPSNRRSNTLAWGEPLRISG